MGLLNTTITKFGVLAARPYSNHSWVAPSGLDYHPMYTLQTLLQKLQDLSGLFFSRHVKCPSSFIEEKGPSWEGGALFW